MILHHLEMYGEDREQTKMNITTQNDGVAGQPQIEPSFYCTFNIKQIFDSILSVAIRGDRTSKAVLLLWESDAVFCLSIYLFRREREKKKTGV